MLQKYDMPLCFSKLLFVRHHGLINHFKQQKFNNFIEKNKMPRNKRNKVTYVC